MGKMILDQIKLTKLKKIKNKDGDVFHGLKKTESSYFGVGEVYFSWINKGSIKETVAARLLAAPAYAYLT